MLFRSAPFSLINYQDAVDHALGIASAFQDKHLLSLNKNTPLIIISTFALIGFGGNSTDLLGHKLSDLVNAWGALGISNLLLIGLLFWNRAKVAETP